MSLSRSVYYYKPVKDDSEVIHKLEELSEKYPRRGCDKFYDMIRSEVDLQQKAGQYIKQLILY